MAVSGFKVEPGAYFPAWHDSTSAARVGGELCKVLTERREGIGRIGRKRQHVARADLHDGHGRAAVDASDFVMEETVFLSAPPPEPEVDVDRQRHGEPGFGSTE